MIEVYVKLVMAGTRTIDSVPEKYRAEVKKQVNSLKKKGVAT